MGIIPCCFTVLDMCRVESYLLFYPFDNSPEGDSLWELGLNFVVTPGKTGYRGCAAHAALKGKERIKIFGLVVDAPIMMDGLSEVFDGDKKVGYVTIGMYSELRKQSLALVRLTPATAVHETKLTIKNKGVTYNCMAHTLPFDDPKKTKRMAK